MTTLRATRMPGGGASGADALAGAHALGAVAIDLLLPAGADAEAFGLAARRELLPAIEAAIEVVAREAPSLRVARIEIDLDAAVADRSEAPDWCALRAALTARLAAALRASAEAACDGDDAGAVAARAGAASRVRDGGEAADALTRADERLAASRSALADCGARDAIGGATTTAPPLAARAMSKAPRNGGAARATDAARLAGGEAASDKTAAEAEKAAESAAEVEAASLQAAARVAQEAISRDATARMRLSAVFAPHEQAALQRFARRMAGRRADRRAPRAEQRIHAEAPSAGAARLSRWRADPEAFAREAAALSSAALIADIAQLAPPPAEAPQASLAGAAARAAAQAADPTGLLRAMLRAVLAGDPVDLEMLRRLFPPRTGARATNGGPRDHPPLAPVRASIPPLSNNVRHPAAGRVADPDAGVTATAMTPPDGSAQARRAAPLAASDCDTPDPTANGAAGQGGRAEVEKPGPSAGPPCEAGPDAAGRSGSGLRSGGAPTAFGTAAALAADGRSKAATGAPAQSGGDPNDDAAGGSGLSAPQMKVSGAGAAPGYRQASAQSPNRAGANAEGRGDERPDGDAAPAILGRAAASAPDALWRGTTGAAKGSGGGAQGEAAGGPAAPEDLLAAALRHALDGIAMSGAGATSPARDVLAKLLEGWAQDGWAQHSGNDGRKAPAGGALRRAAVLAAAAVMPGALSAALGASALVDAQTARQRAQTLLTILGPARLRVLAGALAPGLSGAALRAVELAFSAFGDRRDAPDAAERWRFVLLVADGGLATGAEADALMAAMTAWAAPDPLTRATAVALAARRLDHAAGPDAAVARLAAAGLRRAAEPLAQTAASRAARPREGLDAALSTGVSGLTLAAPFLPRLFERLGLLADRAFRDPAAQTRALDALAWLAHGAASPARACGPLELLLCGAPTSRVGPPPTPLDAEAAAVTNSLLTAIIAQWAALGHTSPEGLRETFIRREGLIAFDADGPRLRVAPGPFDMLLDRLPWPIGPVRLPWMAQPLRVRWRGADG